MKFQFHGGSWFLGWMCAATFYYTTSPWWLLLAPFFLIETRWTTFRLWPRSKPSPPWSIEAGREVFSEWMVTGRDIRFEEKAKQEPILKDIFHE